MITNKVFDERLDKARNTIAFKNETANNCYSGSAVPPTYMDITLADYIFKTDDGLQFFLKFINQINEVAPIDSMNFGYPGMLPIGTALIWWSKVKMPGRELGVNDLWQVEEKKIMQDDDYNIILNKGYDSLVNKIVPQVVDMNDLENFIKYHMENDKKEAQAYIDNGYPVLCSGSVCPPFETLCGGRSMNQFFMDIDCQVNLTPFYE